MMRRSVLMLAAACGAAGVVSGFLLPDGVGDLARVLLFVAALALVYFARRGTRTNR